MPHSPYHSQYHSSYPVLTTDPEYSRELRCKVTFKSRDNETIYYVYDSFYVNERPFNLTLTSIRLAYGEVPSFQINIEDHQKIVDKRKIGKGVKVVVEVGKYGGAMYKKLVTGYVRVSRSIRSATNSLFYSVTVHGSQIIFNERVVNFKRAAKREAINSSIPLSTDSKMKASNLFRELLNATDILPLDKPTIKSSGSFTELGISDEVDDFIAQIAPGLSTATDVANALSEVTGALWGVENDDVYFRFPTAEHSGILIKGTDDTTDKANIISYNMGPLEFEDSIDIGQGFANKLYVLNAVDTKSTASSSRASGSSTLSFRAIAVQWTATESNVTGAAFILSKVGEPTNTDNSVYGYLRADNQGYPTGATVLTFKIPFDQIETSASTLFVNDLKHGEGAITVGNKYWWMLYTNTFDDSKSIRWHHDNDVATPNRLIAHLPFQDRDPTIPGLQLQWVRSVFGPVYAFSTFSSVRHILTQSDPESIERYGLVEAIVDLPAFEDDATFQKALHKILERSALPKRLYDYASVTLPYDKIFLPGTLVSLVDEKSDLTTTKNVIAEVHEVNYNFDVQTNGIGLRRVDIRLMAFVDEITEEAIEALEC